MKSYLVMAFFAFYVVAVTLLRSLRDEEFHRLTAMKRLWGRQRGLVFHFLANIALPLVLGIVFISIGVAGKHVAPHPKPILADYSRWMQIHSAPKADLYWPEGVDPFRNAALEQNADLALHEFWSRMP